MSIFSDSFIADLDSKQKKVIEKISEEMGRVEQRVDEINLLKTAVEASYAESTASLQQVSDGVKAFAIETEAKIETGAQANSVAGAEADHVHGQVNEVFEKTLRG